VIVSGGNVVGRVPEGLPSFRLPWASFDLLLQLLPGAIALSLVGFIEAIAIAKAMAVRMRHRLDPNQELFGQGLANLTGALFQGYPVSGSFSRSAVNLNAGARTGFASVVTTIIVIVALLFCTPLLYCLPEATLAAVIMMAVIGLVNFRAVTHLWRTNREDGVVAVAAFLLTLAFAPHLDWGILLGALLALVLYLHRTMEPTVVVLARHPDGTLRDADAFGLRHCEHILVLRFDGRLYFANTSYFEETMLERLAAQPGLKAVIVMASGINSTDASGEEVLDHLVE
jgi:SulP family sulfate permease